MFASAQRLIVRILRVFLRPIVLEIIQTDIRIWGDPKRVKIANSAYMVNTLFNVSSGSISVGEFTFTGHNVSIITGKHDFTLFRKDRMRAVPSHGCDVEIGSGVWIGSNVVILGPCRIGNDSVIAAGSVVTGDIPPLTLYGGVPARLIRQLSAAKNSDNN